MSVGQGFFNLIFQKDGIKRLAARRELVCQSCPFKFEVPYAGCGMCGCYRPAKQMDINEKCPLDKWDKPLQNAKELQENNELTRIINKMLQ